MSDGITYCEDCINCIRSSKSEPAYRWLCLMHPRLEGFGFVTKTNWDNAPPYLYCRDVNGGRCVLFQRVDPNQIKLPIEPVK
jgi:hypothetical protein